jgi:hypothetical protein
MNAVAQQVQVLGPKTPIETALETTFRPVVPIMGREQVVKTGAFIQNLVAHGENALDQANQADICTEESFGLAGDLVKAINAKLAEAEKTRKAITSPMDDAKAAVMKLFGVGIDKLKAAKEVLQGKQTTWAKAEKARLDAIAKTEQEAATQRALDLAAAQQSMGDNAGADQVLAEAASTIEDMGEVKVAARGMYGSSSGLRTRWVGEVTNSRLFLAWLATQPFDIGDVVDFRKSGLNALAKKFEGKTEIPGFTATEDESTVSR